MSASISRLTEGDDFIEALNTCLQRALFGTRGLRREAISGASVLTVILDSFKNSIAFVTIVIYNGDRCTAVSSCTARLLN